MTELNSYTDEQILAHLMGEGDPELRSEISAALARDPDLSARLATLAALRARIQQLPVEIFYRRRKSVSALALVVRAAVLAVIFFTGALAQSEFSILRLPADTPGTVQATWSGDFPFPSRVVM